uniref:Uncharacterized protein n=1 Tax=viral metagenome TaxID=1070528 RepID=A0A6C0KX36_9ZZZZ|tara:strand:- start:7753 stop:8325 length:573 start_codon:yes stop_codon:yes gene_type:complete
MSSLAFSASPIDFQKNEIVADKINSKAQNKLSMEFLKKMASNETESSKKMTTSTDDVENIHNNLHANIKSDNEKTLGDFYASELGEETKQQLNKVESSQDLYHNESVLTDYLISNNLNLNKISGDPRNKMIGNETRDELLEKLNYIINLFEDEREIKTNKKNEEIVLYCFLGIFVIYVLDSFVSIGKYKR